LLRWLCQIIFRNRFKDDIGNDCLMGVDGTDFQINRAGRKFYSHKYQKSGLRYEVATSLIHGELVWINGPYECGKWPDISIFRNSLMSHLSEGERVEADDGYIGECPQHVKCPGHITGDPTSLPMQADMRKRHETINMRFKQWGILKQVFRSKRLYRHGKVFRAVAILTQIAISNGEPLFQVEYEDPHLGDLEYFEDNGGIDYHGNPIENNDGIGPVDDDDDDL
jgi:hypothetical protein